MRLLTLLLGLCLLAPPALAAPTAAQKHAAGALYQAGVKHFRAKQFKAAAAKFSEAYQLDPAPTLLYNLARAQESAGLSSDAIKSFRTYMRLYPTAEDRAAVEAKVQVLEATAAYARLGTVQVQGVPAGSVWRVNDTITAAERGQIKVPAGDYTLFIAAPNQPRWAYAVKVAAGTTVQLTYGEAPPEVSTGISGQTIAGLASLGGAVLFAGVGTGLLLASQGDDDDAADRFEDKRAAVERGQLARAEDLANQIDDLNDSAAQNYTLSLVSFGVAAIAAGAGTFLLLTDAAPEATTLYLSPTLGGLGIGGTF
jgi:tetratricopeptide (TPR) repeat protein